MPDLGNVYFDITVKLDQLSAGIKQAQAQIAQLDSDINKKTQSVSSKFENMGKSLSKTGKTMSLAVTAPLVAAGGMAVKTAADFESMGNTFKAVSGATSEQFKRMSDLAKELGNDITLPGTSATDAAAAMTELVKAGLSIDDTFKAAKATLQLSAAAQIDNAEAATIVGQALNAFGLSGDKAITVADLLANSANASAGEITDMAYALQAGASVANMAGQSIEDFTTAISLMANAGVTGSDAGTSLKSMFMSLISPTDKAAKTMKQYGLNVYDANGQLKPLPELVDLFSSKLGGMTDQQRNATLATIFGSDAIRAANIVLIEGANKWDNMSEAVNKSGGAAEVAGSKMQGTKGQIEALKSNLETLAITIGEKLLPFVNKLVDGLTKVIDWFSNLSPATQDMILKMLALAAAIGPVILTVGKFMEAFSAISKGIKGISKGFGLAKGAIGGFKVVLSALTGPIGIAVLAIAGIVTAAILIYKNWDKISSWLKQTWQSIAEFASSVWGGIVNFFSTIWDGVSTFFSTAWNGITTTLSGIWNGLKETATVIWEGIKAVIMAPVTFVTETVPQLFQEFVDLIINAFQWLYNHNYYFQDLVDFIVNVFTWLKETAIEIWNSIVELLTNLWNGIKETATAIWTAVSDFFTTAFNTVKNTATNIWNGITTFLSNIWNGIKNTASRIWNGIKNTITSIFNTAKTKVTDTANGIKTSISNIWNSIWNTIKGMASKIWNAVVEPFNTAKGKVLNIVGDAWNWGKNLINNIIGGIKSMIGKVADVAKDVAGTIARFLGFHSPAKEGPGRYADEWMPNLMKMLQQGIDESIPALQEKLAMVLQPNIAAPAAVKAATVTNQQNAPLLYIENMSVRNDQDIDKLSQAMYNQNMKVMRAMGRKSI
ncbi:phage tail tape measure protein [Mahella australiensis]|uniref:Phage tail tape measure protein, TP901 family n=1 Tax=Mahella australiensis (strain DSM 15567 / CIP 107919 / 50-1 BON) TaxID=697281 RepID=F3ZVD4_MAHA5|nr:phage tail tape measure protein [Mahella australiensis]AEE95284.1 phage tail tape measure protein, TP901 family [Mahella australiensis 50-1 BON]